MFFFNVQPILIHGKGRGVVATHTLKEGTCILKEIPYAWVPLWEKKTIVCSVCANLSETPTPLPHTCQQCSGVFACQHHPAPSSHPCQLYKALSQDSLLSAHQKTLTLLAWACLSTGIAEPKFQTRILEQHTTEFPAYKNCRGDLRNAKCAPVESLNFCLQCWDVELRDWSPLALSHCLKCLQLELGNSLESSTLEATLRRFQMNAFYACDDLFKPHSACVYTLASQINHACAPNAICTYSGVTLTVSTIRQISEGEEISIAYVDLIRPIPERQHILQLDYGFLCSCIACSRPQMTKEEFHDVCQTSLRDVTQESNLPVDHFLDPDKGLYTDLHGRLVIDKGLEGYWPGKRNEKLYKEIVRITSQLDQMRLQKHPLLIPVYAQAVHQLEAYLNPLNRTLYGLRSELFSMLLESGNSHLAVEHARPLLVTLAFVYRFVPRHPQFALLLNTYLDLLQETGSAISPEAYRPVRESYRAVYGPEHIFSKAVA